MRGQVNANGNGWHWLGPWRLIEGLWWSRPWQWDDPICPDRPRYDRVLVASGVDMTTLRDGEPPSMTLSYPHAVARLNEGTR